MKNSYLDNNRETMGVNQTLNWGTLFNGKNLFKFGKHPTYGKSKGKDFAVLSTRTAHDASYSINLPISKILPVFPILRPGIETPIISFLISEYNILPNGISNYKDEKSKEGVEGFAFMESVRNYELSLLDIIDENISLKTDIYIKIGIDIQKYDPKTKIVDSGLFVSSISQPVYADIYPDLIGQPDLSKSPIMPIEIWIGGATIGPEKLHMCTGIPIKNQGNFIFTDVQIAAKVDANEVYLQRLKTWSEFETSCVYYKDSSQISGKPFFKLAIVPEVLAPSLLFSKDGIRFQWKFKLIRVLKREEISHQLGRTSEKDDEEYQAFLNYEKKYSDYNSFQESYLVLW
jgi:hypothetical protein